MIYQIKQTARPTRLYKTPAFEVSPEVSTRVSELIDQQFLKVRINYLKSGIPFPNQL